MEEALPLEALHAQAVAALRSHIEDPDRANNPALRNAAEALLAVRDYFYTRDGQPDILGRTHAYRQWAREVMDDAGVPPVRRATVQSAVRYHVGNLVRTRYTADELGDLGLVPTSPRERSASWRETSHATLALFGSSGKQIAAAADIAEVIRTIEATLARIPHAAAAAAGAEVRAGFQRLAKVTRALAKA